MRGWPPWRRSTTSTAGRCAPTAARSSPARAAWTGARIVCHCLLIETADSLVLIDTGMGIDDMRHPYRRLGVPFTAAFRPRPTTGGDRARADPRRSASTRPTSATSPSPTSTSTTPAACPTSPTPRSTSSQPEHEAAVHPTLRDRARYPTLPLRPRPELVDARRRRRRLVRLREHPGAAGRRPRDPADPAGRPLARPHRVAVRDGDGWMLHCGDAYFHRDEIETPRRTARRRCGVFQTLMADRQHGAAPQPGAPARARPRPRRRGPPVLRPRPGRARARAGASRARRPERLSASGGPTRHLDGPSLRADPISGRLGRADVPPEARRGPGHRQLDRDRPRLRARASTAPASPSSPAFASPRTARRCVAEASGRARAPDRRRHRRRGDRRGGRAGRRGHRRAPRRAGQQRRRSRVAGPVEGLELDELRRQFEVNVFGQVAVTQAFLPMIRAARGRVVFMSSIGGRSALPYISPYSASKHAIEAIGDSLRQEMRPFGVEVSIIEPGVGRDPDLGEERSRGGRRAREQLDPVDRALRRAPRPACQALARRPARRGVAARARSPTRSSTRSPPRGRRRATWSAPGQDPGEVAAVPRAMDRIIDRGSAPPVSR